MRVYWNHEQKVVLLCKEGRKLLHVVLLCDAKPRVRAKTFEKSHICYWREAKLQDKCYPVGRAIRHFKRNGRQYGITNAAKKLLSTSRR